MHLAEDKCRNRLASSGLIFGAIKQRWVFLRKIAPNCHGKRTTRIKLFTEKDDGNKSNIKALFASSLMRLRRRACRNGVQRKLNLAQLNRTRKSPKFIPSGQRFSALSATCGQSEFSKRHSLTCELPEWSSISSADLNGSRRSHFKSKRKTFWSFCSATFDRIFFSP